MLATFFLQELEGMQINSHYFALKLAHWNLLCHEGTNAGKHMRNLILELEPLDGL